MVPPRGKKTPVPQDVPLEPEVAGKIACISEPGRCGQPFRPLPNPTTSAPLPFFSNCRDMRPRFSPCAVSFCLRDRICSCLSRRDNYIYNREIKKLCSNWNGLINKNNSNRTCVVVMLLE